MKDGRKEEKMEDRKEVKDGRKIEGWKNERKEEE